MCWIQAHEQACHACVSCAHRCCVGLAQHFLLCGWHCYIQTAICPMLCVLQDASNRQREGRTRLPGLPGLHSYLADLVRFELACVKTWLVRRSRSSADSSLNQHVPCVRHLMDVRPCNLLVMLYVLTNASAVSTRQQPAGLQHGRYMLLLQLGSKERLSEAHLWHRPSVCSMDNMGQRKTLWALANFLRQITHGLVMSASVRWPAFMVSLPRRLRPRCICVLCCSNPTRMMCTLHTSS